MNADEEVVWCHCVPMSIAVKREVKKAGPNQGREFWCCANMDNQCKFFSWASPPDPSNIPADAVMCKCSPPYPAVRLTVCKSGPNTGREFWSCSRSGGRQCSFFRWHTAAAKTPDPAFPD